MAASYVLRALETSLISLVFGNASPAVPPWGARSACSAPTRSPPALRPGKHPPFLLDMSPAVAARGRSAAPSGAEADPLGYALDAQGRPTTDPKAALGVVLPIGGYKARASPC